MTKKTSTTKKTPAPKKARKTAKPQAESAEPKPEATPEIQDPIGDETDGEARAALESQAGTEAESEIEAAADAQIEVEAETKSAEDGDEATAGPGEAESDDAETEFTPKPRPPAKLDRLQKILAQAGVASRRKAEELIEQGRVQVNGKVITELGTKADAARDHIRVDGKLLQGAERLRYFVLNKPRGFVTTVKDPEGRPTVMQFFDKMRERLYPVGRLDYMSEGLLLVTNDGELANRLTRAAAGVEKTYLVKVAGQPTEAELDILRGGVAIERGKPGSDRVHTSPARIRQVRQGDNPWYEVVLIEGRNRELRKMFEEIGHFVEKIRRVGYGPLILDQEPGNLRELDAQELMLLRKAADGTLRTPKSKEIRRRNLIDALPAEKPAFRPRAARPAEGSKDYRPKRSFESRSGEGRTREARGREPRTGEPRSGGFRGGTARPTQPDRAGGDNLRSIRSAGRDFGPSRPAWKKDARPAAGNPYRDKPPAARPPYAGKAASDRGFTPKPAGARPFGDRPAAGQTYGGKPAWSRPGGSDRPPFKRPAAPHRESVPARDEDFGPVRPPNLHIEEIHGASRPTSSQPSAPRPYSPRPNAGRPSSSRPSSSRPSFDRPKFDRPSRPSARSSDAPYSRPSSGRSNSRPGRSSAGKPFRSQGGLARPFTTSSGKPRPGGARPGGARPSSKSRGPADRSSSGGWKPGRPGGGSRPAPAAGSGPRPSGNASWKQGPSSGGTGRPSSGGHSRPPAGGFSKSGYKGKPSGSGPRSFGKRPGGPSGSKKRR
jgi:23S rRNA pseudouridine2605 synthase